ncbi:MAG: hypothetical protein AB1861_10900 [Cyanobacteriota bacterium]
MAIHITYSVRLERSHRYCQTLAEGYLQDHENLGNLSAVSPLWSRRVYYTTLD